LIGALRSVQDGRIEVFGDDLSTLGVDRDRRNIAFTFRMHNLFDALPLHENLIAVQPGG
jgi:ABC-type polar amino acid transport system ATPase subunit